MLVGDEHQVRRDPFDPRVIHLDAHPLGQRRKISERVDEHARLLGAESECGLAVPLNPQR
jgi:hypothetical protein